MLPDAPVLVESALRKCSKPLCVVLVPEAMLTPPPVAAVANPATTTMDDAVDLASPEMIEMAPAVALPAEPVRMTTEPDVPVPTRVPEARVTGPLSPNSALPVDSTSSPLSLEDEPVRI
jgi:hypothetical protein